MQLNDLIHTTGAWLCGTGAMTDIVVSSRVRLARNLADQPFLSTASPAQRRDIFNAVSESVATACGDRDHLLVDVDRAEALDRQLLVERHLISRNHADDEGARGVTITGDERRSLMINEEDHLRIQALSSGLQLEELWDDVNDFDEALSQSLAFAFDKQLGYLTACPTNVGTGIRVSVMVHLPALKWTKEIERVERAARDMRLAVRGLYGEGTEAVGDFYQISNQTTIGTTEEEVVRVFTDTIIPQIAEYERAARRSLVKHSEYQLDDRIWRAYGVLANARCIGSEETQSLLSPIRMGIHLGRFDLIDIRTLNELFLYTQPAHLQKRVGRNLEGALRAVERAKYLRTRLT